MGPVPYFISEEIITGLWACVRYRQEIIYVRYKVAPGGEEMAEENAECSSCEQGQTCPSKTKTGLDKLPVPEHSSIRHVVAVMSGKGGVGKSTVTALIASALAKKLHRVGVLDADITLSLIHI